MTKTTESYYEQYLININNYKIIKEIESNNLISTHLVKSVYTKDKYLAKVFPTKNYSNEYLNIITHEIEIMIRCSHPTLLPYIGFSKIDFQKEKNITVFIKEHKNGTLADLFQNIKKNPDIDSFNNTKRQILLIGIARGMMYLHYHHIIHHDLRPSNIFLNNKLYPLISDFGLLKLKSEIYSYNQSDKFNTIIYLPPESIENEQYSEKSDVYSFGIIMYEIITNLAPFPLFQTDKMTLSDFTNKVVNENYRPQIEVPIKKSIQNLMESCWSKNPKERPTFEQIFKKMAYNYGQDDEGGEEDVDVDMKYYLDDVDAVEVSFYLDEIDNQRNVFNHKLSYLNKLNGKLKKQLNEYEKNTEELEKQIVKVEESFIKLDEVFNIDESALLNSSDENIKKEQRKEQDSNSNEQEPEEEKSSNSNEQKNNSDSNSNNQELENNNNNNNKYSETITVKSLDEVEPEKITILIFNELHLYKQQSIVQKIIRKMQDSAGKNFLINVNSLLIYMMRIPVILFKCLTITSENPAQLLIDLKDEEQVNILNYPTEQFLQRSLLESSSFIEIINKIRTVSIEMRYPSDFYKQVYSSIIRLKKKADCNIQMALLFSGIESIDFNFRKDKNINSVDMDLTVNRFEKRYFFSGVFNSCTSLTKVTISPSIEIIEPSTFDYCTALKEVIIPPSVIVILASAFYSCSALKKITIPSSVKYLGPQTFKNCISLTQITIPSSMVEIDSQVFYGCTSLTSVYFERPYSLEKIEKNVFEKCSSLVKINFPPVTKIRGEMFSSCSALTNIVIPSSVTVIESKAFAYCQSLTHINIPHSVKMIDSWAFEECTALARVFFEKPYSLKKIGDLSFVGCVSLVKVAIPPTVTEIGSNCFDSCTSLEEIIIHSTLENIGADAFPEEATIKRL